MAEFPGRRKEDRFPGRVWVYLRRFFIFIGVLTTFSFAVTMASVAKLASAGPGPLPDRIVLTYAFKSTLAETPGKPSLTLPFLKTPTTFRQVIKALQQGAKDPRVKGLAARIDGAHYGVAQLQDLRDALAAFRKAGKFAYVYSDSLGGMAGGIGDYYLASAFDGIWVQPVGVVAINGFGAEVPFLRGAFDKVGVLPQFSHKGIYKSAAETLTNTDMSAPNREATESLVSDLFRQITADAAASRGIALEDFLKDVDNAPYNDKDALARKLIDHIGYYDEMLGAAREKAGVVAQKNVELIDYATQSKGDDLSAMFNELMAKEQAKKDKKAERKIALIYGTGEIVPFKSSRGTFGDSGMAAEKVVDAFRAARKDKDVAAVVFRVDSPGGSPEAAETIRRAVMQFQRTGRPVVVSMGAYAASGGYWIATPADSIVAQPGTITGSIGVFGGKMVVQPLEDKVGVKVVSITKGANAGMWSPNRPFSDAEYAKFDGLLANIYEAFLQRVMEGRKMTHAQAEAVAEGRVWTGAQAKDRGLVDVLGGLDAAVAQARELAKIPEAEKTPVREFPAPKSPLEQLIDLATDEDEEVLMPRLNLTELYDLLYGRASAASKGWAELPPMDVR